MNAADGAIVVAGHICLDIIPSIQGNRDARAVGELLVPGKLVDIGRAVMATGGAVSNTGLALHRLGMPVKLMGKVGDDLFGDAIVAHVRGYDDRLAEGMIVAPGESSSYTIVVSPPGVDRIFLHHTGANDTFVASDVDDAALSSALIFHFGYPPLMRGMYAGEGRELAELLRRAKTLGATVSLDMARPDPDSPAGRAEWRSILEAALPHADVFVPSFEEILYMLRPDTYRRLTDERGGPDLLPCADGPLLGSIAEELLAMGAAIVGIKLGEHGLYIRTTGDADRLAAAGRCSPTEETLPSWLGRELLAPCFAVEVAGTTGAGDCTIAGLLAGLAHRLPAESALLGAVGVGACNVERPDAVSGVPDWETVNRRIAAGWPRREPGLSLPGWKTQPSTGIWEKTAAE